MSIPTGGQFRTAAPHSGVLNQNTLQDSGCEVLGQLYFPGGTSLFSGAGAPGATVNGRNPVAGDVYFRVDTPGTNLQRLYICTVGGATPTWVGIL